METAELREEAEKSGVEIMNLAMASPGTEFMVKTSQRLQEFAIQKASTDPIYQKVRGPTNERYKDCYS